MAFFTEEPIVALC